MNILNKKSETTAAPEQVNTQVGENQEARAIAFAATQSEALGETLARIAKARQDYEGGPFAVLFKVSGNMTEEQIDNLPNPSSETGNNPAKYKVRVEGGKDGKGRLVDHYYYDVVSDNLACNIAKRQRIEMLNLSLGDPTKVNMAAVPADIMDMPVIRRGAEVSRLEGELTTSRKNINEAFELLFQIRAVNECTGVTANVLYALDDKGVELNGEDGRPAEVENTRTPIVVTTTVEGRKGIDTARIGVTSFKKLRPEMAKERGGTYRAVMDSAPVKKKGKNQNGSNAQDQSKPQAINTLETFEARLTDLHDYLDTIYSDSKQEIYGALLKKMNAKTGNENLLQSITEIRDICNDVLAKTYKQAERYQAIITKEASAA